MRSLVVTVIIINCAHCTEITVERQQCRRKKCLEAEPTAHVRDETFRFEDWKTQWRHHSPPGLIT